jgi:Bacillus haemolytic enterotoxin (HBL).
MKTSLPSYQLLMQIRSKRQPEFRDNTWKGLVDLSGKIINYAKVAGGTVDSSYYVGFLQSIQDYHDTTEQKKKDDAREAIKEFTNDLIARITELQTLSVKARDDLETFKTATTKHSSTLQTNEEQVKKLLDDTEIKRLEGEIKTLQKELDAEHDELSYGLSLLPIGEHMLIIYCIDLKVAETTPAYAWV